jgi:hypothetical protein
MVTEEMSPGLAAYCCALFDLAELDLGLVDTRRSCII